MSVNVAFCYVLSPFAPAVIPDLLQQLRLKAQNREKMAGYAPNLVPRSHSVLHLGRRRSGYEITTPLADPLASIEKCGK